MRIISSRIIEGPNIYSYFPILRTVIDIGKYENISSEQLPAFVARILLWLPGLKEHRCSRGRVGGFVERLNEGTYLPHIFEHVLIELQCSAGYRTGFGKARSLGKPGLYEVVVGYCNKEAALAALDAAYRLITAALSGGFFDVEKEIKAISRAGEESELGPSTKAIYQAALSRGIPVSRVGNTSLLFLGYGCHRKRVWAGVTGFTSAVAVDIACDKQLTKEILAQGGIEVPYGYAVNDVEEALGAFARIGGLAVIKPNGGNQGKGVTIGIINAAQVERAFMLARQYDKTVIVEEQILGRQYRLCVVDGKMVAAAERIPAYVVGDGVHSVAELVDIANEDPLRGEGHAKPLSKLKIDAVAVTVLAKQNLTPHSVPEAGRIVCIRENANLSTGSTAVDVTDIVHPYNAELAVRAARLVGLDIAGVDIVAEDIAKPIEKGKGAVIEINAAPGLRMHLHPKTGKPRDVGGHIINYLFPNGSDGRIPIIAITGTNGKTTVARMISRIWRRAHYNVGMTSTDGIFINDCCVLKGDTTGPDSARAVLGDPSVEVAVLETARGGMLRGGLAFDRCDVGIVTNITEDHLGQDGVETLEDLAFIKSLVLETVSKTGSAIVNADDRYITAMVDRITAEVVYFSLEPNNIVVRRHLGAGGKAVFVKDGTIYVAEGSTAKALISADKIPATLNGIALHNLQNAVIAAAACWAKKIPLRYIRDGLAAFEENPGRLTFMSIGNIRVCVDYGHNPAGYQALINTVTQLDAARLVGVIAAPGDRRNDVIKNIGRIAGRGFDKIYIKEDEDLRGRQPGETARLLYEGVVEAGFEPVNIEIIPDEQTAVKAALVDAQPGDLVVIFYEKFDKVMNVVEEFAKVYSAPQKTEPIPPQAIIAGAVKLI